VALDKAGSNIIVVEQGNNRLLVFDRAGIFEWNYRDQLKYPFGVAVNAAGNIVVTDTGNDRVQVYDEEGVFLRTFGSKGSDMSQLKDPYGVAVDAAGNIVVVDDKNHRVQGFGELGTFVWSFGSHGSNEGQSRIFTGPVTNFYNPFSVLVDVVGNIVVADLGNHWIQVFDELGTFLQNFGSKGTGDSQFNNLTDVTVDAARSIVVTDSDNQRVQILISRVPF